MAGVLARVRAMDNLIHGILKHHIVGDIIECTTHIVGDNECTIHIVGDINECTVYIIADINKCTITLPTTSINAQFTLNAHMHVKFGNIPRMPFCRACRRRLQHHTTVVGSRVGRAVSRSTQQE